MKFRSVIYLLFITAVGLMVSCDKNVFFPERDSRPGSNESHNMGDNCMSCHKPGGQGTGTWYAAGTVYDKNKQYPLTGGKVYLYTRPNGQGDLAATLDIDAKGNFYTSKRISFSGGLYPAIQKPSGAVIYMQEGITGGACNFCHNHSTDKIFSD